MQIMLTGSMVRAERRARHGPRRRAGAEPAQSALGSPQGRRAQAEVQGDGRLARAVAPVAGARVARQEAAQRDVQEGARGALSGTLPPDRPVRDARRQPRRHESGRDARVRAADGERHLAQPAPRLQALGDDEGAGAEGPALQAAARACDRCRRDGRRHRRLVRGVGHGGDAAGRQRRADRQGHCRTEEALQAPLQDQGPARRRECTPDRRSHRAKVSPAPTS